LIAEGDKVGWRYTFRGTHSGELMGIPPTGGTVTITGSVISRFAAGKFAEDWHQQDALGMLHQIGATSLPG
jgi:predicted ester cyclase